MIPNKGTNLTSRTTTHFHSKPLFQIIEQHMANLSRRPRFSLKQYGQIASSPRCAYEMTVVTKSRDFERNNVQRKISCSKVNPMIMHFERPPARILSSSRLPIIRPPDIKASFNTTASNKILQTIDNFRNVTFDNSEAPPQYTNTQKTLQHPYKKKETSSTNVKTRKSCPCLNTVLGAQSENELHRRCKEKKAIKRKLSQMRDLTTKSLAEKKRIWVGVNGRFSKKRLEEWYVKIDTRGKVG